MGWLLLMLRLKPMLDTSEEGMVDMVVMVDMADMEATVELMEAMPEVMEAIMADTERDLLMLSPRLMLLLVMESALFLMAMLHPLLPMLLLLPSPSDMVDMVMELESGRDLLMLRLTPPSSTDLTAMLPPLLPTDMLSPPPLSDPTPSLLTELEDMDMELMDLTGNSSPSHSTNQYSNSKDDVKSPKVDVNVLLTFFSAFKFNLTSRKNKFT